MKNKLDSLLFHTSICAGASQIDLDGRREIKDFLVAPSHKCSGMESSMSIFFDDTKQGLLEAVEISNGNIPITEMKDMPAPTFRAADIEKNLIDEMIVIGS